MKNIIKYKILILFTFSMFFSFSCELFDKSQSSITINNNTDKEVNILLDNKPKVIIPNSQSHEFVDIIPGPHNISFTFDTLLWTGSVYNFALYEDIQKTFDLKNNEFGEIVVISKFAN